MIETSTTHHADPSEPSGGLFASDYGHFTADGLEYVISRRDTPRPWTNVLCNGDYGCIVSQAGGGFSWRSNSQLKMLNRWDQDLIRDACGRFLYIRDRDDGAVWSADWLPSKVVPDAWQVRHGLGYTVTTLEARGIRVEKTVFVPMDAPCEIWRVRLSSLDGRSRRLDLFPYLEWQLGAVHEWHREFHKVFMETEWLPEQNALYAWKRAELGRGEAPFAGFVAVLNRTAAGFDGDKESFLGRYWTLALPDAVAEGRLSGNAGRFGDAVAALHVPMECGPGTVEVVFAIGAGSREDLAEITGRFKDPPGVDAALDEVRRQWRSWVEATRVETPDPALDLMTNAWLKYQAIVGRMWARTGYYQNSGAFGFRDQLQDSHVWLPLDPERAKQQILLHASRQFPDGTVQHWWHPGTDIAPITDCSDDLLWLPYLAMNAIDETGDSSLWDETAPFIAKPGESAGEPATLYEHAVRAIEKALTRVSPRGLPLIGEMDWNDGLSHLGRAWKGESVWLAHFLAPLLRRFAGDAEARGETDRAVHYRQAADGFVTAVNEVAWDGEWYWRATKDIGETIGSHTCDENKIDLIAQAWSVIGGTAPPDRARQAMASARKYLFREYGPLLLTPAYSKADPEIGYITRYAPGIRENGGVYSHAATWGIQALCMLGEGDAAWNAFASMCPPRRGEDPDLYYGEPYVMPGNIDGPDSPTFGRGGWTWYTGSAAWMQKVALEWICGVRATRAGLVVNPCIPAAWDRLHVRRLFRGATYEIEITNPNHVQHGVRRVMVEGQALEGNTLPIAEPGTTRQVAVEMGAERPET